jgi:hypothetical protein
MSNNTILATAPLTSTNYILKATGTTIGNSLIWDNGTNVGIGNTNISYTLDVTGTGRFSGENLTIGSAVAATNVKLFLNGVASKAAGIEFQQSGTTQWYIGNGIASEDNNFELYNSNGTMAMKIIKSTNAINFIGTFGVTGAATFSSSVTAGGNIAVDNASRFKDFAQYTSGTRRSYLSFDETNGDLTLATQGSYPIKFSPNQTLAMNITNAGIVTIPLQVSFKAYLTSNPTLTKGSWQLVPYGGTQYDIQGNFSTSTYKFTAPVAGKYLFTVNLDVYGLDDTAQFTVAIVVNSATYYYIYNFANLPTGNTGDTSISGSNILNLSASNTVDVRVLTDGSGSFYMSGGANYNTFTGHLLG